MKKLLLCILVIIPFYSNAEDSDRTVGTLRGDSVKVVYDPILSVACYATSYRVLSCVYIPPKQSN